MQSRLIWDDLRHLLAVGRFGSFVAAARALGIDHSTVGRRVSALERELGHALVVRTPRGVSLTPQGEALSACAERMEQDLLLATDRMSAAATVSGVVRLATPEAFGTFLVAPHVAALTTCHPALRVELVPESRLISLINREADLAVALNRPPRGRLAARKLTDYHIGLYASRDFLDRHGAIEAPDALRGVPFASYIDELIAVPELDYLREAAEGAQIVFRSSTIAAQQAAVAAGLGVGLLHVFAARADPRLVRILPTIEVRRSYWLVLHEDERRSPRIRAVVDFLDGLVRANAGQF